MGKTWLILLSAQLFASGHVLHLMSKGDVVGAVQEYRTDVVEASGHDFEMLQQMALVMLEGASVREGEEQMLAMFGAGVTQTSAAIPIFRNGISSQHPEVQAAAINFLARLDHDNANDLLKRTLASPFLLIRLEALFQLAQRRDPDTVGQLESLMVKVPPELYPLFPQLFAMVGTTDADTVLRRMLADRDPLVRRATILALTNQGRDDFLPDIRRLSLQLDPLQQEVCAAALGRLQDTSSQERLDELSYSPHPTVRVAALQALYRTGREAARFHLEALAREGDPYALFALGEVEGSDLSPFLRSRHPAIRINATAAMLAQKDPRCLTGLREILVTDSRDLGFVLHHSPGGALSALRPLSSLHQRLEENPGIVEMSLALREALLAQALEMPGDAFLTIAKELFEEEQNDLIPALVAMLEAQGTEEAYALLEVQTRRVGAPLIRDYCNLALFRAGREGPYEENLHNWIRRQRKSEIFQLRPMLSFDQRSDGYTLTPEETSRLLIESFEALGARQDEIAVDCLLDAIEHGAHQNWAPLAGLLYRLAE
jgi:hypothetical protein